MKNTKVILKKTGILVVIYERKGIYYVDADTSYSKGGLHFTHEFSVGVKINDDKLEFLGGSEIACEDIEYTGDKDGRDYFESIHPGLLEDLQNYLILPFIIEKRKVD